VELLEYSLTWTAPWLQVTPADGRLQNFDWPQSHTVHLQTASLPVGAHATWITVAATNAVPSQELIPILVEVRSADLFTAYNDFAWQAGQLANNITCHTSAEGGGGGDGGGELIDFASGQPTGVMLSISGAAYFGDWQAALGALSVPGTDAHDVFYGTWTARAS